MALHPDPASTGLAVVALLGNALQWAKFRSRAGAQADRAMLLARQAGSQEIKELVDALRADGREMRERCRALEERCQGLEEYLDQLRQFIHGQGLIPPPRRHYPSLGPDGPERRER